MAVMRNVVLYMLVAIWSQTAASQCEYIRAELDREKAHKTVKGNGQEQLGRSLCFPNYQKCGKEDLLADELSLSKDAGKAEQIRRELEASFGWAAYVTDFDLDGDGVPEIRVSRRVGSAACVRDTYLKRTDSGFELINSPTLNGLSSEASYCGRGDVYLRTYRSKSYVVTTFDKKLRAYRIGKDFELIPACSGTAPKE